MNATKKNLTSYAISQRSKETTPTPATKPAHFNLNNIKLNYIDDEELSQINDKLDELTGAHVRQGLNDESDSDDDDDYDDNVIYEG